MRQTDRADRHHYRLSEADRQSRQTPLQTSEADRQNKTETQTERDREEHGHTNITHLYILAVW